VGKINDFTIKPVKQYSYLLSGFSWHTLLRPSFGIATLSTTAAGCNHFDTICTRPPDGKAVNTGPFISRKSEPSSSDPELGSNINGCSSEDEMGRSGMRMNVSWDPIDEQRLLAYKKEGKSWPWIFR
jgi:hypothetical protein